ncbi:MAG: type IX secretion system membrane protein PorP/SprF [Bacteroidota bacterium]
MKKFLLFLSLFLFLSNNSSAQQDANFPRRSALIHSILPGGIPTPFLTQNYHRFISASTEQQWSDDREPSVENLFINGEMLNRKRGKTSRIALGFHFLNQHTQPIITRSFNPRIALRHRLGKSLSEGSISLGFQPGLIWQTIERATFNPFHPGDKILLNTERDRLKINFSAGVSVHRKINEKHTLAGGYSQIAIRSFNFRADHPSEASTQQIPHHYLHLTHIMGINSYGYLQTQLLYSWIETQAAQLNISTRYYRPISTSYEDDKWGLWIGGNWTRNDLPTWGVDVGVGWHRNKLLMLGIGWEQINIARREILSSFNLSLVYAGKKQKKKKRD